MALLRSCARHRETTMTVRHVAVLALLAASAPALAASDLTTTILPPAPTKYVYESGTYTVRVNNIGNQTAQNVTVTIDLPETNTSPTVHIMGILGTKSATCTTVGTQLRCTLGSIQRNKNKTVFFNIAFPENEGALVIDATSATTSVENSTANNGASHTAALLNYAVPVTAPQAMLNTHCTGTDLTSFYECVVSPGSTMNHEIVLLPGGGIDFPGQTPGVYTGAWSQNSSQELSFMYFEFGTPIMSFQGYGVDGGCFEGITQFFPSSPYVAPYEVCPN
jgi:uncharacterized repeat protein (TIGR01451 family)